MPISTFHKVCSDLCHNWYEEGHSQVWAFIIVPSCHPYPWTIGAELCTLPGTKHGFLSLLLLASLAAERKDLILDQVFPPAGLDPVDSPWIDRTSMDVFYFT